MNLGCYRLADAGLSADPYLMLSHGGLTDLDSGMRVPIRLCESGPAAGVTMGASLAASLGIERAVSFDMGGTTAKICMIADGVPRLVEYNVRFGDPECQPLLMRLQTDLLDVLEATVDERLDRIGPLEWDARPAVCVVMASQGYPGHYTKGHKIRGLSNAESLPDVKVFHAGTALKDGDVVTSGGRVLSVTALGDSISMAKLNAYRAVKCIRWHGAWCRKDISDKASMG